MWSINHTKPWRVHRTQGTLHHFSYHNWGIHVASTSGWLIVVGYNVLDNHPCFVRNTVTQNWLMTKLDVPLLFEPVVSCILQHRHNRPHWEPPLHLLSWWVPPHSGSQCRGPQCSGGRGLSQPPDITQWKNQTFTQKGKIAMSKCAWQIPVSLFDDLYQYSPWKGVGKGRQKGRLEDPGVCMVLAVLALVSLQPITNSKGTTPYAHCSIHSLQASCLTKPSRWILSCSCGHGKLLSVL